MIIGVTDFQSLDNLAGGSDRMGMLREEKHKDWRNCHATRVSPVNSHCCVSSPALSLPFRTGTWQPQRGYASRQYEGTCGHPAQG